MSDEGQLRSFSKLSWVICEHIFYAREGSPFDTRDAKYIFVDYTGSRGFENKKNQMMTRSVFVREHNYSFVHVSHENLFSPELLS